MFDKPTEGPLNQEMKKALSAIVEFHDTLAVSMREAAMNFNRFAHFATLGWSRSRWRMQAKNGRNSKERRRDQVRLKGRRCRRK